MNRGPLRLIRTQNRPPEALLMEQVSRGDEQAFSLLYDQLAAMVFGVVLRVVRDRSIAEEVTQEVFVEIWRIAPRFDRSRGSVRAWGATIAHRKAVDRVRSEQARRDREDREHVRSYEPPADVVAEEVEHTGDRARVHDALDQLTERQREAVTMAYFGGRTYQEVAAVLDVPEGTVKTRIRDGLIKLRDGIASVS